MQEIIALMGIILRLPDLPLFLIKKSNKYATSSL
jgi:hypothetical protein